MDPTTQATSADGVFCAGDLAGVAKTTVEAANGETRWARTLIRTRNQMSLVGRAGSEP